MISSQPNPYEQAVRHACDHANAGPDLDGLSYMEARIAIVTWNHPGANEGDPFRSNVCPDCGEPLILALRA